jgi:nitroreductase
MAVAAELQIDACPMEWFSPADYDTVLGLAAKNLASVVVLPVGYRSAEDKYAHAPKVRFEEKDVVIKM